MVLVLSTLALFSLHHHVEQRVLCFWERTSPFRCAVTFETASFLGDSSRTAFLSRAHRCQVKPYNRMKAAAIQTARGNNSTRPPFLITNFWEPNMICSLIFKKWRRFSCARICRFRICWTQNTPPPTRRYHFITIGIGIRSSATPPVI